jgi:thioesterase domain-containing protein
VATLFESATIEKLARVIDETPPGVQTEIVELQPRGANSPLFLVHGMGGDLWYARPIVKHLGEDTPVYGLQSIDDRLVRFEDMASRLVAAMRQLQPHGPYRIGGYCFGGVMAYEIACQLRALGCEVSLLAILDTALIPSKRSIVNLAHISARFLKNLPFRIATDLYFDPPDRLLWRVKERILLLLRSVSARLWHADAERSLGDMVDVDRIRPEHEARWQRDFQALLNYGPSAYDGRLLVVRAYTRPLFTGLDHDLGWSRLVKKDIDVRVVPGHHGNVLKEPQVNHVAAVFAAELADGRKNDDVFKEP